MDADLAQTSQHRAALRVGHGGNGEDGVGQANGGHFFHRFVQRDVVDIGIQQPHFFHCCYPLSLF